MRVAVIGGIQTLARDYDRTVTQQGHTCVLYNVYSSDMLTKLRGTGAIVLFTRTVSHQAAGVARSIAHKAGIPLVCPTGSGVSSLRRCLDELVSPRS
jgi:hypothetical protein